MFRNFDIDAGVVTCKMSNVVNEALGFVFNDH